MTEGTGKLVFLSYARLDGRELAGRLATDLSKAGQRVWIDLDEIGVAEYFDARIERGIRESQVFAALMTPRALVDDSVCRDEIAFAFNERKEIVPLLGTSVSGFSPPLLLARRNWVNLSDYEKGRDLFIAFLRGDHNALLPPTIWALAGAEPLEFDWEIAAHSRDFIGREWLSEEIDDWLAQSAKSMFVVIGEPGAGKSAFAARLVQERDEQVVAVHFCAQEKARSLDPNVFVLSIAAQLRARMKGLSDLIERRAKGPYRSAADAFGDLIVDSLHRVETPAGARLLVVDGLDASVCESQETILDVLLANVGRFPPWLRVLATSNRESQVLERIQGMSVRELGGEGRENQTDLRKFVTARLGGADLLHRLGGRVELVGDQISRIACGNFLYARLALDAIQEGDLDPEDLSRLPPGLSGFYANKFHRAFPDRVEFRERFAPLLSVLVAARAPLSGKLLGRLFADVPVRIEALRPWLRVGGRGEDAEYSLFHHSLSEWLLDPESSGSFSVTPASGDIALGDLALEEHEHGAKAMSEYSRSFLTSHLAAADRWADLLEVVRCGEVDWLGRWVDRGHWREGLECLGGLFRHLESTGEDPDFAGGVSTQIARILTQRGRFGEARQWLQRALVTAKRRKGRRVRAIAHHELGSLALYEGELHAARLGYLRALRLSVLGLPRYDDEAAANLLGLASIAALEHRCGPALRYSRLALWLAQRAGDRAHTLAAHRLMGEAFKDSERWDEAEAVLRTARGVLEAADVPSEAAAIGLVAGWLSYSQQVCTGERPVAARRYFEDALSNAETIGDRTYLAGAELGLVWCALADEDAAEARAHMIRAEESAPPDPPRSVMARLALGRAALCHLGGALKEAGSLYSTASDLSQQSHLSGRRADALVGLGATKWHAGDTEGGTACWARAIEVARRCESLRRRLVALSIERSRSNPRATPL